MPFLSRITLVSLLLTASVCLGQNRRPPTSYEDYGACPFECCTYRRWSVNANMLLYKQRSTSSGVAFRVSKGDHVIGLTGVVVTVKPGEAVVKKAVTMGTGKQKARLKPGDVLYLLHYEGEGIYKIWFRGRIYEDEVETREESIHLVRKPDYVWWVKVKNRSGQVGWSKENKNFGDMDACG